MLQPPFDLALSTLGVAPSSPPRPVIEWAAGAGFRSIMFDAARSGLRPRDLDRSARRGIASLLRRLELRIAGAELWIPPEHYASAANSERALAAALSSIDLLAELALLVETDRTLTVTLPSEGADEVIAEISDVAIRAEIMIANASWPGREQIDEVRIGIALDPRAISRMSDDPIETTVRCQTPPCAVRWSYSARRPEEVVDPLGYASALSVAGFQGDVALDLRDTIEPETDALTALTMWRQAHPFH